MSQVHTIGRVTADFELQTSQNQNNYVHFNIAENIGHGDSARAQFLQVWAWGSDAKALIRAKVKKGSLIWVSGSIELEEFQRQDKTTDKRLKVMLKDWGFIPTGKPKGEADSDTRKHDEQRTEDPSEYAPPDGSIDGDREELPV